MMLAKALYLYYNQPADTGVCEQHEALTFMCLQPQLDQLRQRAPRLFEALCGCLTQSNRYAASYLPEHRQDGRPLVSRSL